MSGQVSVSCEVTPGWEGWWGVGGNTHTAEHSRKQCAGGTCDTLCHARLIPVLWDF